MSRFVGLAVLVALVYFAVTQGRPWIESLMDGGGGALALDGGSAFCISQASAANDEVTGTLMAHARPPVDPDVWSLGVMRAVGALNEAEKACTCATAACNKGWDAVAELRALFDDLDQIARGNPMGVGNPARRQERVYRLLDEARAMAGSE